MTATRRVALVGCGKAKLTHPAPARELYTSNLFRLSAEYAERFFDGWYVVSALHGLVDPDHPLAPYDCSLAEMRDGERRAWAGRAAAALRRLEHGAHFTLLAGGHYRYLAGELRLAMHPAALSIKGSVAGLETPLNGLGIGQRMAWLKGELEAAHAA